MVTAKEHAIRNVRTVLWRSVSSLAGGTATIQERLLSPAMFLTSLGPGLESLPVRSRHELEAIIQGLTQEGTFDATLRMMSDDEAVKLANRIVSLYIELRGGI
jgi:hypothetical protein